MNTPWDEFFDPDGDNPLQLTEDEANDFKQAILDLIYEELFKHLRSDLDVLLRLEKRTARMLLLIIVLQLIWLALQLRSWLW